MVFRILDLVKDIGYVLSNFLIATSSTNPWNAGVLYFLGLNALFGMWLVPMIPIAITFWCMLSQDEMINTKAATSTNERRNEQPNNLRKIVYLLCSVVLAPIVTILRCK